LKQIRFKDLPNLSGEIMHEDSTRADIDGAAFWKAGPEGRASSGPATRVRSGSQFGSSHQLLLSVSGAKAQPMC
jgi:hypothetical protein